MLLSSLFIGWGLSFIVLVDRDKQGQSTKKKLIEELSLSEKRIIQPDGGITIEDLFSTTDFRKLLKAYEKDYTLESDESPSKAIRRLGINKVLLSRKFSELASADGFSINSKTETAFKSLFKKLRNALGYSPPD